MGTVFYNFKVVLLPFRFCKFSKNFHNSIRNCPPQKVQLGACGGQTLKLDAFRPTKRIKKLFTVPVQTGLVCYVYRKDLAVWGSKRHMIRL